MGALVNDNYFCRRVASPEFVTEFSPLLMPPVLLSWASPSLSSTLMCEPITAPVKVWIRLTTQAYRSRFGLVG